MVHSELILLGTGDAESLRYWNSNALIRGAGRNLLIDAGYTIKYALAGVGIELPAIDAIFISHVHGDHVHGLERIGFESRYSYNKRVTLYLEPEMYSLIWDHCLFGSMGYSDGGRNKLEDFFEVHLITNHQFYDGGCHFRTFPTPHTNGKPSYGITINQQLVFTSDTNIIPDLAQRHPQGLIVHDCCLQAYNPVHATLHELLQYYSRPLRQRMLLTHYGDQIPFYRSLIEQEFFGLAYQGQVISLK